MHFDLVDLRLLVKVAEANSLTGGAERANLSLPAASSRIRNLEDSIGVKLLYRSAQGVTLTPPGQAFVHHARLVLSQVQCMRGDLQEYAKGIKGHLRVFANTTSLGEFLPPVLSAYLRTHPCISIDLRERMSHDIVRAVTEGQTDIGIVGPAIPTGTLDVIPYRDDRTVLVVPAGHPLARAERIAFADTLDLDHVGLHEASAIHSYLRKVCNELHRKLELRIQVSNFETACRMIEAEVGVGVIPESAARRHSQTMAIEIVPLSDEWALRALKICVRSFEALPPFARDLVDLLVEDARGMC